MEGKRILAAGAVALLVAAGCSSRSDAWPKAGYLPATPGTSDAAGQIPDINLGLTINVTAPSEAPTVCEFPLAGAEYPSNRLVQGQSVETDRYRAVWTNDGRLWQPGLPPQNQRQWFAVAFEIPNGDYVFNGVIATLHVDTQRNGRGSANPVTVADGNGLPFSVRTADGRPAWALVESPSGVPAGFEILDTANTCGN